MDFAKGVKTANIINKYVNQSTNGLIEKLVEPNSFDVNTKLMLINAVYFYGKWKIPFKTDRFVNATFKVDMKSNKVSNVTFMTIDESFNHAKLPSKKGEVGVIELPYKDEDFAMYLILPPEDMDVRDFNWTELDLHNLDEKKMKNEYVTIELPKFKIDYKKNLQNVFKNLGAADAFGPTGNKIPKPK